ncbi:MAG: pantoate--beta-alanine ligase [Microbacteriaceae bacterium]|nr:pantoate--beta-alanine ligase [Microbacteriaceae bacterium]
MPVVAETVVVETISELRSQLRRAVVAATSADTPHPRIALVPTMGALHDGHLALIEQAQQLAEIVVVSIFVNPLQFGSADDLARYPRTIDADRELLTPLGVPILFAPSVAEMYPARGTKVTVHAGPIGERYEGKTRRGHFDGVLTVVAKLLHIVAPHFVLFGQKDAQQVFLVSQLVADLNFEVSVVTVDTVRAPDGLALSSRNRFLDERERRAARALSVALEAAESSADRGVEAALAAAQSALTGDTVVHLDYLTIVDPATFLPADVTHHGRAVVLVAAVVGDTRLIDSTTVHLG